MTLYYIDDSVQFLHGDAAATLALCQDKHVNCILTSPPYFKQRDYNVTGQLGHEGSPTGYAAALVNVFREARRVLRDDGVMWLNMGDVYYNKQLLGIPWRVAFALQDDGWILRSEVIWHKSNPMPSSVTDRPSTSHEQLFLFSKKKHYYYDTDSIREPYIRDGRKKTTVKGTAASAQHRDGERWPHPIGANSRSVWKFATAATKFAHFATMPEPLAARCITVGCPKGGTVLDPFMGSGTTSVVARDLGRKSVGIELNESYIDIAIKRLK